MEYRGKWVAKQVKYKYLKKKLNCHFTLVDLEKEN
jgi:hypothetical protein